MQLLEKKVKCPLCGAKNGARAARCAICTRPLNNDPLPSQALYDEALWSTKIASKRSRKATSPYLILVVVLAVGLCVNYFVVKAGPDWMHEPVPLGKGFSWEEQTELGRYRVDLPGHPIREEVPVAGVTFNAASVWVDGNWEKLRDEDTRSIMALQDSIVRLHSGLVVATGPAPMDPASSINSVVAAMSPGAVLADGGVTALQDPDYGAQWDLVTTYTGWPEESKEGTVRARVIVLDNEMFVAATFTNGGDDPDVHERLVQSFVPNAAPSGG